ncbi:MAG: phosphatase PAP2 family protein [Prevotella sp.]|nr:phosphatase PAP2 family protein [Bacteroides sp.]MCM1366666.1 phosphatase PAP2 family protein [Prevotella sp.]MCM1437333.1 phosphatase PAP2 family protein [Prevotella sp.]
MQENNDTNEIKNESCRPKVDDHSRFLPPGQEADAVPTVNEDVVEFVEDEGNVVESVEDIAIDEIGQRSQVDESEREEKKDEEDKSVTSEWKNGGVWGRLSNIISWLMVPMMMPVYAILLIFGLSVLNYISPSTRLWVTLIVAGINLLLPAIIIVVLKRIGVVQDLGLNGRKERLIPYLASIMALCATAWFMWSKQSPAWVWLFFLGGAVGGVINLIINFRWKISAHAAGVAGIVALILRIASDGFPQGNVLVWLMVWILLAGLTGSARLYLKRHTLGQVLAGYAVGFFTVYFISGIHI